MLWNTIMNSLKAFNYMDTYIALFVYLAIFYIPVLIEYVIVLVKKETSGIFSTITFILTPLLHIGAVFFILSSIAPIIFGFGKKANWNFPIKIITVASDGGLIFLGVVIMLSVMIAIIPSLSQLYSLQTMLFGVATLVFVLGVMDSINPNTIKGRLDYIPDLGFSAVLIIFGGLISWLSMMLSTQLVTQLSMKKPKKKKVRNEDGEEVEIEAGYEEDFGNVFNERSEQDFGEGLGMLLMFPGESVFGFIPVFMYGAWLGAQTRGGF